MKKRLAAAVLCILTALAAGLCEHVYVREKCRSLHFANAIALEAEGSDGFFQLSVRAAEEWESCSKVMSVLLKDSDVDDIGAFYAVAREYALMKDREKTGEYLRKADAQVELLRTGKTVSADNIF